MTPSTDLRYPIGPYRFGHPVSTEDRPLYLAQLAEAPAKLRAAVAGLSDAQLDTPYRPGGWTVRQVVHHLADAHVNWYIRPKLAVTGSKPAIKAYDESLWAELPDARISPIEPSLMIFEGIHARWVLFFESLQPEDWSREFLHPERGLLSVDDALSAMAWHSRHHTAHITGLRQREGW
ncbi:MAG TPA: putative metal-dependent hydrolase [Bryobacteraceae bacterium]|jgi:uncharacterized damage-inducible protein DinB